MAGSSKDKANRLVSDPSRIHAAVRNGRDSIWHLLNELKNRADPQAATAMKETYSALMDFILDGQRGQKSQASNNKSKGKLMSEWSGRSMYIDFGNYEFEFSGMFYFQVP